MKKLKLLVIVVLLAISLVGCSSTDSKTNESANKSSVSEKVDSKNDEAKEISKDDETTVETSEPQQDSNEGLTVDNIRKSVDLALGEGDIINDINIEGDKIKVNIKLGDPDPLTEKDLAISRFGSISDKLLEEGGWNALTVDFEGLGPITLNSGDAVTNEFGLKYFNASDYEGQL